MSSSLLCPDCDEATCVCPPIPATDATVAALALDAYTRAGGNSVLAVLWVRECYRVLDGIDGADLIDRAQRWLLAGMGAAQRQAVQQDQADLPVYLRLAEARHWEMLQRRALERAA